MTALESQEPENAEFLQFLVDSEELNKLEDCEEPEFIEVDVTMDTGAESCVLSPEDVPTHVVRPSKGSKAGQRFQAVGGKLVDNEGEVTLDMVLPAEGRLPRSSRPRSRWPG